MSGMGERDPQRLPGGQPEAVVEVLARQDRVVEAPGLEHRRAAERSAADDRLAAVLRARRRGEGQRAGRARARAASCRRPPQQHAWTRPGPTAIPADEARERRPARPRARSSRSSAGAAVAVAFGLGDALGVGVGSLRRARSQPDRVARLDQLHRDLDRDVGARARRRPPPSEISDAQHVLARRVAGRVRTLWLTVAPKTSSNARAVDRRGSRSRPCRPSSPAGGIELDRNGPRPPEPCGGIAVVETNARRPSGTSIANQRVRQVLGRDRLQELALAQRRRLVQRRGPPSTSVPVGS